MNTAIQDFLLASFFLLFLSTLGNSIGLVTTIFKEKEQTPPFTLGLKLAFGLLIIIISYWHFPESMEKRKIFVAFFLFLGLLNFLINIKFVRFFSNPRLSVKEILEEKWSIIFFSLLCLGFYKFLLLDSYLPDNLMIPTRGNFDIFNYINNSNQLLTPSAKSLSEYFKHASPRIDSFGAFALIAAISEFTGRLPYETLGIVYVILFIFYFWTVYLFGKTYFRSSRLVSFLIASHFVFMPLFQYIYLNFFLGQMIASLMLMLAVLDLLTRSNCYNSAQFKYQNIYYFLVCFTYIGVMFFTYFSTLIPNILLLLGLQFFLITESRFKQISKKVIQFIAPLGCALLFLSALSMERFAYLPQMLRTLASIQAGWSLQYISPISLLGIAFGPNITFAGSKALVSISFICFLIFLIRLIRKKRQLVLKREPRVFFLIIFTVFWLAYNAAYIKYGPDSYNQWKVATFYPMLFSMIFPLLFFEYLFNKWPRKRILIGLFSLLPIFSITISSRQYLVHQISMQFKDLVKLNDISDESTDIPLVLGRLQIQENMIIPSFIRNRKILYSSGSFYPKTPPHEISKVVENSYLLYRLNPEEAAPQSFFLKVDNNLYVIPPSITNREILSQHL